MASNKTTKAWRDEFSAAGFDGYDIDFSSVDDDAVEAMGRALRRLRERDDAYRERDQCVAQIAAMAVKLGYPAWISQHDAADESWDPAWRSIVFVELPTGQVSWHIHVSELHLFSFIACSQPSREWDGHSTEEKYERLLEYGHKARDDAPIQ